MKIEMITETTSGMLVEPDICTMSAELAAREGERRAAIYTKRGYPHTFAGLVVAEVAVTGASYLRMGDVEHFSKHQSGYRIVLTPIAQG